MSLVRSSDALAIDDVHPGAVCTEGYIVRLIRSRDQTGNLIVAITVTVAYGYYGDGVRACIDGVKSFAVSREGYGKSRGAGVMAVRFAFTVAIAIAIFIALTVVITAKMEEGFLLKQ